MVGMLLKILHRHTCHRLTRKKMLPRVGSPHSTISSLRQIFHIREQTTEAAKFALRKEYGLTECSNPLLALPVDIYTYVLSYRATRDILYI